MQVQAKYKKYTLNFIQPAGTSRGVYISKDSWLLFLTDGKKNGVGECSLLQGLSIDDRPDFDDVLKETCCQINAGHLPSIDFFEHFPAIGFGFETAMLDLKQGGHRILYNTGFSRGESGIVTNGLIWMGSAEYMQQQIAEKLEKGFSCIKLKIGSLDWVTERSLIEAIRKMYPPEKLTIRVDANGAYAPEQVHHILDDLAMLGVHSIEQPIKAGLWKEMARLCASTPVPIALDEELIGVFSLEKKRELLHAIHPQYLILKPGLLGGFAASDEWIGLAEEMNIGWWATSALESNIGLNAIAQWVSTKSNMLPQGLGTGLLFSNNIGSPLYLQGERLFYNPLKHWDKTGMPISTINGNEIV